MADLFSEAAKSHAPLAARMRPRSLDEYVGQAKAVGTSTSLRRLVESGTPPSLILWGPPGTGKTSLAAVVASTVRADWRELSAVTAGVKDVREILADARVSRMSDRRTVLFLDEIHRFNKAQQDALLPGVEDGTITLIGATTENPFFELNAPLLSRCTLVRLESLDDDDIRTILTRAVSEPRGLADSVTVSEDALDHLVSVADGDARAALTALDVAASVVGEDMVVTLDLVSDAMTRFRYDKAADSH